MSTTAEAECDRDHRERVGAPPQQRRRQAHGDAVASHAAQVLAEGALEQARHDHHGEQRPVAPHP